MFWSASDAHSATPAIGPTVGLVILETKKLTLFRIKKPSLCRFVRKQKCVVILVAKSFFSVNYTSFTNRILLLRQCFYNYYTTYLYDLHLLSVHYFHSWTRRPSLPFAGSGLPVGIISFYCASGNSVTRYQLDLSVNAHVERYQVLDPIPTPQASTKSIIW